jgi:hypothetical protein
VHLTFDTGHLTFDNRDIPLFSCRRKYAVACPSKIPGNKTHPKESLIQLQGFAEKIVDMDIPRLSKAGSPSD